MISEAHNLIDGLGVSIVTSRQYLGGFTGPHEEQLDFVKTSVVKWISTLDSLIAVAKDQPELVYTAVTRSFQNKWLYLQRVIPDCSSCLDDLEQKVATELLPTLFGCEVSPEERIMFCPHVWGFEYPQLYPKW